MSTLTVPADADIYVTKQGRPPVPDYVQRQLDRMHPRVFLEWNNEYRRVGSTPHGTPIYEPRWEIWVELDHSPHPDAANELLDSDRYNYDEDCWMRKLQVYQTADGEFAPADERLITGLKMADAWSNRRFYEENVEEPDAEERRRARKRVDDAVAASASANRYAGAPHVVKPGGLL